MNLNTIKLDDLADNIFSEIANPAASSPALLMRKPEDNFANDPAFEALADFKFEYVFIAAVFVPILMCISS